MIRGMLWLVTSLLSTATVPPSASAAQEHGSGHHSSGQVRAVTGITSLDVYRDGSTLHLLIARDRPDAATQLFHLASPDGGATWSAPRPVSAAGRPPHSVRRGADAQIAAQGERLLALWTAKGSGFMGSGPLVVALSEDGGRTWHPGANPANDGSDEGHAFADVVANARGFHAVWLDNRNKAQGLRYAATKTGAEWSANRTLVDGTCECCWNTMLSNANQLYVLFRGKSPRDMALVASANEGATWDKAKIVGGFGWDVNACPHVGGGLAVTGFEGAHALHAVVWTGQEERAGLYHLTSFDAGRSWAEPRRIGSEGARNADLAASGDGAMAVVWDDDVFGRPAILLSLSHDGGHTWSEPARISAHDAEAAHPRITAVNGGFIAFWTEARDGDEAWKLMSCRIAPGGRAEAAVVLELGP